ncbi:SMI1/KNR4 family protein [Chryseobacterium schmidteae]|uniref:SMI1/KNR4 family protein n=1 Tax=Chryseobacterium schmidteae TaxID=2730404 RepID=UPI00158A3984|nr:SMI1/KNR4 family protein [Chryseobacterium schmidteae]
MDNNIDLSLSNFTKNEFPSHSLYTKFIETIDFNIDKEYLSFISKYNGAEGNIGKDGYLSLWDIENVLACNPYYDDVEESINLFFIGTDGANYGYAFDKTSGEIVGIDFLDIGEVKTQFFADSFLNFLRILNSK